MGYPRERGAEDWGGGSLAPQSPPPSFPFSHPKLPGSPWLPRQPLLPGAVTKETPCPPLPLPHHWRAPPPQAAAVWRWEGQWWGKNSGSHPRKGGPHLHSASPPTLSLHLQPRSWIRAAITGRTPPPARPGGSGDPPRQLAWPREPPPDYLPHPLRLSIRPRPLSSAADPPPPGGGLRPRSPN